MKTSDYLVLAAVGFALTACTNEDLVNEINPSKNDTPKELSFNAHTTNQTRANLQNYVTNFGVWAYEYNTNATTPTTEDATEIMGNFEVDYTSTSTHVWHYHDVNSQGWKYWNYSGSTHTTFYAYAPHKTLGTGESFTESSKTLVLSYGNSLVANSYEDAGLLIADMKDVRNDGSTTDYGKSVELTFKRHTCKIKLGFYSDYKVNGVNKSVKITRSNITLTPVAAETSTTADGHVVTSGTMTHVYGSTPSSSWSLTSEASAISFPIPVGAPDTSNPSSTTATNIIAQATSWNDAKENTWTWSPSSYYSVPCATDATTGAANINTILKAEFEYFIEGETSNRTATVYIPTTATNWQENYLYTYVFKISGEKNDAIVFANPTVEDYSEASPVYEYTITAN